MHLGKKSDLLVCLETCGESHTTPPDVEVIIFDGAAVVNMLRPGGSKMFENYAQSIFPPYIKHHLQNVTLIEVIWDRYLEHKSWLMLLYHS